MSYSGGGLDREETLEAPENGFAEPSAPADPMATYNAVLRYVRICLANRRLLLRAGVATLVTSLLLAFLIPARYESTTRLMPPDNLSSLSGSAGLAMLSTMTSKGGGGGFTGMAGDLLGLKTSGALFVGILGSETVQDRLITYFDLRRLYRARKIEDAREKLAGHTDISEDRKSGIITIRVADHDPKRAAAMAQAYVTELDRVVAQVSTSSARRERIFLEGRLSDVKHDLNTAAVRFSDFASKNTAIDIPAQGRAMVDAAARLQGELIATEAELSGLQQIYANGNVRVRSAEARVSELRKKLNELGDGTPGPTGKEGNSLYPSIRQLPVLGVTYTDLYRQTKIEETVYELLTQQYELAKVQEAKEIPSVKVLDTALVPTKRSFPPRLFIVLLGTVLGVAAGVLWASAKERWETMDAGHPQKVFAHQLVTAFRSEFPRFATNGAGTNGAGAHATSAHGASVDAAGLNGDGASGSGEKLSAWASAAAAANSKSGHGTD